MPKPSLEPTTLELFAAFAAQLPLLTREDLASAVEDLRASPGWRRALVHARLQAAAIGLKGDDFGEAREIGQVEAGNAEESDKVSVTALELPESADAWHIG